ncbi:hypothetical protein LXL04_012131 [Taraxacum kok-saghyz]
MQNQKMWPDSFLFMVIGAVVISFAKILLQVTRPRTAILGKIPMTSVYRNIGQYPEATKVPGVLIVRVDSAIYFSNSNYTKESYSYTTWLFEISDSGVVYVQVDISAIGLILSWMLSFS